MDEVDNLINGALKDIGCSFFDDEIVGLKSFTSDHVIEGVVRCLWACDPATKATIPSLKLPGNMTAKFRTATNIADAIKALGYKVEVGYQTLLYGNTAEIRRLFIFLIEKLPKETIGEQHKDLSPLDSLKREASHQLKQDLDALWTPAFCRRLRLQWDGRFWCPGEDWSEDTAFHAHPGLWLEGKLSIPNRDIPATVLEANSSVSSLDRITDGLSAALLESLLHRSESTMRSRPPLAPKPLASKPALSPKPDLQGKSAENELIEELKTKLETLLDQAAEMRNRVDQLRQEERELRAARIASEKTIQSKQSQMQQSESRFGALLNDPDGSLQRLQKFTTESEQRLADLEAKWDEVRIPKQQHIQELRQRLRQTDGVQRMMAEAVGMREKCGQIDEEMETKKVFVGQLQKELEKMGKGLSRSAYTKRILEIVASVRKQREEIDRVLDDNRTVQKEINMLTGNLERTFTAAEERLYKDAQKDEILQRAYRLLVNMHETCGQLVAAVEDTGHLSRELEELQDQIETESQKSTDTNLERLVNDFCQVRQENELLLQRLKMAGDNY
uniref:Coiled-coil domain-containing protein 22 homolog n=1 Tax=Plectus sambesii TaxID=2011161 RepID=A0A914X326_9BILA